MEYLKINGTDYSMYTSALKVTKAKKYNAQTNAAGNSVIDYLCTKRTIEATIIALEEEVASSLLADLEGLAATVSYRDNITHELVEVSCILPSHVLEYYTIREDKVMYKAFNLKFTEL